MSGVFLIVQENEYGPDRSLLQATRGGYPHVTLVYTWQKDATPKDLLEIGVQAFGRWLAHNKGQLPTLVLHAEHGYVNSFYEERTERQRYDVLLGLAPQDIVMVEELRKDVVKPNLDAKQVSMGPPHVTHSIHYSEEAAEEALAALRPHMPLRVSMTGYTID